MHIDDSYTPLRADFDQFVTDCFRKRPTPEETEVLKSVFYAGAASAYGIIASTPHKTNTLCDELADQMERMERERLKV